MHRRHVAVMRGLRLAWLLAPVLLIGCGEEPTLGFALEAQGLSPGDRVRIDLHPQVRPCEMIKKASNLSVLDSFEIPIGASPPVGRKDGIVAGTYVVSAFLFPSGETAPHDFACASDVQVEDGKRSEVRLRLEPL